jgi:hypothetical protein
MDQSLVGFIEGQSVESLNRQHTELILLLDGYDDSSQPFASFTALLSKSLLATFERSYRPLRPSEQSEGF